MACSRTPKCRTRPYGPPVNSFDWRSTGRKLGSPFGVVLFEPANCADSAVGFNVFAGTDSPEVLADQLMAIFHGIYRDTGIYANNYLRGAIQALASVPGMTLVDVPVFLLDVGFRNRVVAQVKDPVIQDVWLRFNQKSAAEQRTLVLPGDPSAAASG